MAAGFLGGLARINWTDISVALPVMITVILMPLTFSIAAGISIGFLTYVGIRLIGNRARDQFWRADDNGFWLDLVGFAILWLTA